MKNRHNKKTYLPTNAKHLSVEITIYNIELFPKIKTLLATKDKPILGNNYIYLRVISKDMIGRKEQIKIMNDILASDKSAFLAVTGRRRVGKTYLIDQIFGKQMCISVTGIQHGQLPIQIKNFTEKINQKIKKKKKATPDNWQEVFILLRNYLETLPNTKKQVIFLDELPWINTHKSNFIQLLAHLWNDYLSKQSHFILVICGSATSWIQQKIVNDKGGFHNRLTQILHIKPFTLPETKEFLNHKKIYLDNDAIIELYMAMGGIPYYLENIKRGESPTVLMERMCFKENGILRYEYDNLFKALFDKPIHHEAIIETLTKSHSGLLREELVLKSKVSDGGSFTRAIQELISSGFVREEQAYGKKKQGSLYRVVDEYVIFYHRFIKNNTHHNTGLWSSLSISQSYKIWQGFAFENLCIKHIEEIKELLGIRGIYSENYSYKHTSKGNEKGFQIDLIIDRKDKSINLCECKYYSHPITIIKKMSDEFKERKQLFKAHLKTSKSVFTTIISNQKIDPYPYAVGVIDNSVYIHDILN